MNHLEYTGWRALRVDLAFESGSKLRALHTLRAGGRHTGPYASRGRPPHRSPTRRRYIRIVPGKRNLFLHEA
ncbi:hypothetical protein SBV1_500021 [Verrucomicrobia bacterium]|nr:hypothetical protein SBV1_500021 [Verrucomicrobiota bacterium]